MISSPKLYDILVLNFILKKVKFDFMKNKTKLKTRKKEKRLPHLFLYRLNFENNIFSQ